MPLNKQKQTIKEKGCKKKKKKGHNLSKLYICNFWCDLPEPKISGLSCIIK